MIIYSSESIRLKTKGYEVSITYGFGW